MELTNKLVTALLAIFEKTDLRLVLQQKVLGLLSLVLSQKPYQHPGARAIPITIEAKPVKPTKDRRMSVKVQEISETGLIVILPARIKSLAVLR